jgi:hypothetical protein
MNTTEAFKMLIEQWHTLPKEFKSQYRGVRCRYLKSQTADPADIKTKFYYVGDEKKKEMLNNSGLFEMNPEKWIAL